MLLTDTVGFGKSCRMNWWMRFAQRWRKLCMRICRCTVDSAHPEKERQIEVVDEVLHQLNAHTIPRLLVYNKACTRLCGAKGYCGNQRQNGTGLKR
ncbi:MAG: hypothetical protein ACLT0Y_06110 [Christensenellales bacterium]